MLDEPWLEALREDVRRRNLLSPEERWADLVRRGIIDDEGNVLIRMPQPPPTVPSPARKKKPRKPRKASDANGEP